MRLYSQTTGNTYLTTLHAGITPADAVEITEDIYQQVIANPAPGKVRGHDADGRPLLVDAPQPSGADLLKKIYSCQIETINHAVASAITAGFTSGAIGAPHSYSSELDDQLNLTGAVLRGLEMPYACRDEQGVKAFRLHTAAQLRQVGDDFTLYKLQLLQHANELKQQLELALAASDAEAMTLIRWEAVQP